MRPYLSIIIPAKDEEQRLPATLERVLDYLGRQPYTYEVIVVDDGSTDGTKAVAERFGAVDPAVRMLAYEVNRGKGYAVRRGMLAARGDYLLMSDADLSTPIEEIEKLFGALDAGAEIAIGSRGLPESRLIVRQSPARELIGRCFNLAVRLLAVPGIHDTQCGFKLFARAAARDVFARLTVDHWAFDVEALLVARKMAYRIAEVPVTWVNEANSKVNVLRDFVRTVLDLLRIRVRWLMRRPQRGHAAETAETIGTVPR